MLPRVGFYTVITRLLAHIRPSWKFPHGTLWKIPHEYACPRTVARARSLRRWLDADAAVSQVDFFVLLTHFLAGTGQKGAI